MPCSTYDFHQSSFPSLEETLAQMMSDYQKIINMPINKNSDMYIKIKTLASQIFSLNTKLKWVEKQIFPQTASGKFLDYHAQTRGLKRKTAKNSVGKLTFSISEPSKQDVEIPVNTICFSAINPEIKFATTSKGVIKAGETSVDVEAKALLLGLDTNLPANTITCFCSFPKYVESVTNKHNFSGGCNQESDEELRTRLLENFKNISNGSNSAYYYNLAMNYDEVISANIIPRKRGRGTVDVIITAKKNDPDLIKKIKSDFEVEKEINVDVDVQFAKNKKTDVSLTIEVSQVFDFANVKQKTLELIKDYFNNLKIAQPLKLAALGAQILNIPGIENYKFLNPSQDVFLQPNEIIFLNNLTITKQ